MKWKTPWLIEPYAKVKLSKFDADADGGLKHEAAAAVLAGHRHRLAALQEVLYAGQKRSVLIVLQGMDTAGKDGTIAHIFLGINPQGCDVSSFKVPTPLEARHDFLWRCHARVPAAGNIGIFNRSHYEDVLSPRVHKLIGQKEARQHMEEINHWEQMLVDNGTVILKFFLHITKEEQKDRLQSRLDDPEKLWKFSAADLKERAFWDDYQSVYEDTIEHTSKKHAPWFVIPANHKWYRNLVISDILVQALSQMKLKYPDPTVDPKTIQL